MSRLRACLIVVFSVVFVPSARATLNCEHLLAVSQTTLEMRDAGHSLSSVLSDIERGDLQQKLNAQEMNLLRQVVRVSYTSEYNPREIYEACRAGNLGIPKPKP